MYICDVFLMLFNLTSINFPIKVFATTFTLTRSIAICIAQALSTSWSPVILFFSSAGQVKSIGDVNHKVKLSLLG